MLKEQINKSIAVIAKQCLGVPSQKEVTQLTKNLEAELHHNTKHKMAVALYFFDIGYPTIPEGLLLIKKTVKKGNLYMIARDAYTNQLLIKYMQESSLIKN